MLLIRPPWVNHGSKDRRDKGKEVPIHAIDIHPDGTKVATAGDGELGGRICIWSMKPILKKSAEQNENVQRLLSNINGHQQSVNALRWANSGDCFASAGADKVVMIWTANENNRYKSIATLRTHNFDVMDIAWSPNDDFLASASMDNTIVIWNAQQWPTYVKIIEKHQNFVKGISWDPIGKYLASQSDDKTLRIWRISDWTEEACIKEPFENSNTSSTFTRIDWSPDGQFLVSAQAMNNDGFVAKIIERNNWTYEKDFVGHRKNVCCVAFSKHIFKKEISSKKKDDGTAKTKPQCVVAIGSRDRSISVWETSKIRPTVVVNDVFENSVLDLSWSPCGYRLMACSLDGTVVLLQFSPNDLGNVYSSDEKQQYLQQFYGKSFGTRKICDTLIEDVNILHAQNDLKQKIQTNGTLKIDDEPTKVNGIDKNKEKDKEDDQIEDVNSIKKIKNNEEKNDDKNTIQNDKSQDSKSNEECKKEISTNVGKQVEIRQADGKKRVMTLLKPKIQNVGIETSSTSSESKSKIIIETYDEKNLPSELKEKFLNPKINGKESRDGSSSDSDDEIVRKKSKKVQDKDESSDEEPIILRRKSKKTFCGMIDKDDNDQDNNEDSIKKKSKKNKNLLKMNDLSKDEDSQINLLNEESQQSLSLLRHQRKHKSRHLVTAKVNPSVQVFASEKLSKQNHLNLKLFGNIDSFTYASIEYPNPSSPLVKLTILENEKFIWCSVLSSPIIFICGNNEIVVVVCEDMTLNTFNTRTGARLNSSFVIESDISKIMFGESKSHVCVLTCEGKLWIWDVVKPKLFIKGISMLPILIDPRNNDKLSITKLNIHNKNVLISVSNGKTYQYEKSLKAWCLLKNTHDPLAVSANYKGSSVDGFRKEILNTPSQKLLHLFSANTSFGQLSLISFIEQQIMRTKLIKNSEEFIFWTKIFVQNLVQMHSSGFNMENIENRLRDLCSSLLGKSFPKIIITDKSDKSENTNNNEDFIESKQFKQNLLNDLLKIIASQTSLQRLYLEFKEQLDIFNTDIMEY